jgi:hypothetical protein
MADEWERVDHEEWIKQGVELFGLQSERWRFICPSCGHVQTLQDFLSLGMHRRQAEQIVGFSCIGSWQTMHKIQQASGYPDIVEFMEPDQGLGCRYHGGKTPNISPITLVIEEGRCERPTFGFAPIEVLP